MNAGQHVSTAAVTRKLWALLGLRDRRHAVLLLGLAGVGAFLEMLGVGAAPAFLTLLLDERALQASLLARIGSGIGLHTTRGLVLAAGGLLLGLFLIKNAYLAALLSVQSKYMFNRQADIARRLFASYLYRPYAFHLQRNTAELLRSTNHDAIEVVLNCLLPLFTLAMEGLTVAALLILVVWAQTPASLMAFLVIGGTSALFLRVLRDRSLRHGQQMHEARLRMIQTVNEGLGGIKIVKVLGREGAFLRAFSVASAAYAESGRTRQVFVESPRLVLETVAVAGLVAVVASLLWQERTAGALVPSLAMLGVVVVRLVPSFNRITSALGTLRYGQYALDAVYSDLRDSSSVEPPAQATAMVFADSIRLDHVAFQYPGTQAAALSDVSLRISRWSTVGIVGPTGCGKTTLVDLILGLLSPTQGAVLIDGVALRGREHAWQRLVGYVPQDVYLADDTIRRNIAFGLPDDAIDDDALRRAIAEAQAGEFIERLPNDVDTLVGERGVRISGGQRQRIGIARALYNDPAVLVLDEATSALDSDTERAVMGAIDNLRGTRTLLVVAHRQTTIDRCDVIVSLKAGLLLADTGALRV